MAAEQLAVLGGPGHEVRGGALGRDRTLEHGAGLAGTLLVQEQPGEVAQRVSVLALVVGHGREVGGQLLQEVGR